MQKRKQRRRIVDELRDRTHNHIGPLSHYIEGFHFYIELDGLSRELTFFSCV